MQIHGKQFLTRSPGKSNQRIKWIKPTIRYYWFRYFKEINEYKEKYSCKTHVEKIIDN